MFDLNPNGNPDALWQHVLMVLISAVLGYIIGMVYGKDKVRTLRVVLSKLNKDLAACQKQTVDLPKPVIQSDLPVITTASDDPKVISLAADDLKTIEGIGPKIEALLNQDGIYTFVQLKESTPDRLTQLLQNSGVNFNLHDPNTWPRQAELAAAGKWEALRAWQEVLNKGRIE